MTGGPYRDSLAALCRRREALVQELEHTDTEVRARAELAIPCFTSLSRWRRWKVRRAWKTIRRLGHWDDDRCSVGVGDPPCPHGGESCGYISDYVSSADARAIEATERLVPSGEIRPEPPARMPPPLGAGYQPRGPRVDPARMVPPPSGTGVKPPPPPIRIITEGKVRKGGVNRQGPRGERPPPPAPGRAPSPQDGGERTGRLHIIGTPQAPGSDLFERLRDAPPVQVRDGKGDLVCGFPTTEPTLFGDPEFRQPPRVQPTHMPTSGRKGTK